MNRLKLVGLIGTLLTFVPYTANAGEACANFYQNGHNARAEQLQLSQHPPAKTLLRLIGEFVLTYEAVDSVTFRRLYGGAENSLGDTPDHVFDMAQQELTLVRDNPDSPTSELQAARSGVKTLTFLRKSLLSRR